VSDAAARAALEAAWEGGIRYYDTAPHYGLGLSERRVGAFLAERPRAEFVVSMKVGRVLKPNPEFAGGDDLADGYAVGDRARRDPRRQRRTRLSRSRRPTVSPEIFDHARFHP
jgi:D-threo-aldose 1-dehydrogenase